MSKGAAQKSLAALYLDKSPELTKKEAKKPAGQNNQPKELVRQ